MRIARTMGMAVALAVVVAACDSALAGPDTTTLQGTLALDVTGGLAGADYALHVTSDGVVVGDRCGAICAFAAGDTLRVLTPAQRTTLAEWVDASGIAALDADVEYPGACCDYFTYELTLTTDALTRKVKGPDATMPQGMADLAHALAALKEPLLS